MQDAAMQIAWCTRSKWYLQRPCRTLARRDIGCAVEVARGVHLQAPGHAAGRRPAYCRRTACPCRVPWRLSLLPQITIMLTNERCPSKTEWRGIGRTGVCRDGTLRQTRPLRNEQKHPGGRKHWFVRTIAWKFRCRRGRANASNDASVDGAPGTPLGMPQGKRCAPARNEHAPIADFLHMRTRPRVNAHDRAGVRRSTGSQTTAHEQAARRRSA